MDYGFALVAGGLPSGETQVFGHYFTVSSFLQGSFSLPKGDRSMRRFLSIIALCAASLSAYGCGGSADAPNTMTEEQKAKKAKEEGEKQQKAMQEQMQKLKESGPG